MSLLRQHKPIPLLRYLRIITANLTIILSFYERLPIIGRLRVHLLILIRSVSRRDVVAASYKIFQILRGFLPLELRLVVVEPIARIHSLHCF